MSAKAGISGAGLVGSLWAIYLAKRGFEVDVFESRPDLRKEKISAGRSINLAISTRGIHALKELGIADRILKQATPMPGRMMHSLSGKLTFQPYGKNDQFYINSISRGKLNQDLLEVAEKEHGVKFHFSRPLKSFDEDTNSFHFEDAKSQSFDFVFGADGANSVIRKSMEKSGTLQTSEEPLGHVYKELTILPTPNGKHQMETHALHIWPRGHFMLIALPNYDGSFTCTLFLPETGPESIESLKSFENVSQFFQTHFQDSVPLIDQLEKTFFENPTGRLVTVRTQPWCSKSKKSALLGDAAHAIVPFFGQGMNAGFEDCTLLNSFMDSLSTEDAIAKYSIERKPHADAIADLAIENFIEMRDRVGDEAFLLKKGIEKILENEFPDHYLSRYSMVSFSREPYLKAKEVGPVQKEILSELAKGIERPEDVDLEKAKTLIDQKLTPFLKNWKINA